MSTSAESKSFSNLTNGSIWNKIILFALPLAATSLLQQLFNSADMAIVGRFEGKQALAAVGSNASLVNLLINLFFGLSLGANVIISRYLGKGNEKKASDAVHTAILVSIISGIFIGIVGIFAAKPILKLMSAPSDVIDLSTVYLRIYFAGMPFIMLYNFSAAIHRSSGDTKKPLISLAIAGVINVILNLIFVIIFKMGVAGVAAATVISNAISSSFLIYSLTHKEGPLKLNLKKLKIEKRILRDIALIGIPAGLQGMVFSLSNVCIQSAVNSLGTNVVSASSAATNIEAYIYLILNAFGQSAVTFISQNYGAGKLDRCRKIVKISLILCVSATIIVSALFLIFGRTILKIYTTDPQIIDIAMERMKYTVTFQFISGIMDLMSNVARGFGYSLIPAITSSIGVCGLRLVWVYTVFAIHPTLATLMIVYPITQSITALAHTISYFIIQRMISKKMTSELMVN